MLRAALGSCGAEFSVRDAADGHALAALVSIRLSDAPAATSPASATSTPPLPKAATAAIAEAGASGGASPGCERPIPPVTTACPLLATSSHCYGATCRSAATLLAGGAAEASAPAAAAEAEPTEASTEAAELLVLVLVTPEAEGRAASPSLPPSPSLSPSTLGRTGSPPPLSPRGTARSRGGWPGAPHQLLLQRRVQEEAEAVERHHIQVRRLRGPHAAFAAFFVRRSGARTTLM